MDKSNVVRVVVGAVIGFIIAFLIAKALVREPKAIVADDKRTVVVRLVTKIDTVKIPQNIYHTDTVRVTLIKQDTIKDIKNQIVYIPKIVRQYADSTKVSDSVYVGYKARVTGTLDKMDMTYSNRKSIVVIHKTDSVFTETTIKKPAKGLYVGIAASLHEVSPTLQYVHDKNIFGVKYNIVAPGILPVEKIGVTYSRKLF